MRFRSQLTNVGTFASKAPSPLHRKIAPDHKLHRTCRLSQLLGKDLLDETGTGNSALYYHPGPRNTSLGCVTGGQLDHHDTSFQR
jgi:hypothetical protein